MIMTDSNKKLYIGGEPIKDYKKRKSQQRYQEKKDEKKICEYCNAEYFKYNFAHHEKTQKHLKNVLKTQK